MTRYTGQDRSAIADFARTGRSARAAQRAPTLNGDKEDEMKGNHRKWPLAAALLVLGGAFSSTGSALPAPPDGAWMIVDWTQNGTVVGRSVYGHCPGPQPLAWGRTGGTPVISYLPCGSVEIAAPRVEPLEEAR
ncbi:hypothetical protein J5226_21605 [Lysobacter sp. K5869]|uniref:hypothetical protein n=1 Tax=Lysobacter sp. K5869 TaxID=2820808 RepID=UPI001C06453B|nr:hypothetical protein [Lysobacter sp. K5869]QWP76155.1 hypothetical protein J5226_21605 [Lysobacter sp. K5869]